MSPEATTAASSGPLASIRLLGPVDVRVADRSIEIRQRRQQQLLALLAINANQTLTAEHILDELWGERIPATGVRVVASYVYRLRQLLAAGAGTGMDVYRTPAGYRLKSAAERVDVLRVQQLAAAAAAAQSAGDPARARDLLADADSAWRGEPLSGLSGPFVDRERGRLVELRLSLLEQRLDIDLEHGRHVESLPMLRALCDEFPTRERFAAQLMTSLCRVGRQAEALDVYRHTRHVLVDELGIEPGAEVAAVHQAVLRGTWSQGRDLNPAGARPVAAVLAAAAGEVVVEPSGTVPVHVPLTIPARGELPLWPIGFRGRDEQLAALLDEPDYPHLPGIALLTGAVGMGKSALGIAAAHRLRDRYPDGQLYLDLQGTGASPLLVAESLSRLLRSVGRRVPRDVAERANEWRAACGTGRYVVVLDNARDAAQVQALIPASPSCRVIITSRSRMPEIAVTRLVALAPLDAISAVQVVAGLAALTSSDATGPLFRELVLRCRGVPAVLHALGLRLHRSRTLGVAALVEHALHDTSETLLGAAQRGVHDELRADLERSTPSERRVLQAAGSMSRTSPWSAACLAAQCELPLFAISRALDTLAERNLVQACRPGWYRLDAAMVIVLRDTTDQ